MLKNQPEVIAVRDFIEELEISQSKFYRDLKKHKLPPPGKYLPPREQNRYRLALGYLPKWPEILPPPRKMSRETTRESVGICGTGRVRLGLGVSERVGTFDARLATADRAARAGEKAGFFLFVHQNQLQHETIRPLRRARRDLAFCVCVAFFAQLQQKSGGQ